MSDRRLIGVDPGVTTGIVLVHYNRTPFAVTRVMQCDHLTAPTVFEALLAVDRTMPTLVQIERFVVGARAARSATAKAGEITRTLIGGLREIWEDLDSTEDGRLGGRWLQRPAVEVKRWATDKRLDAAGLLAITKGMPHARDAARHALFAAVKDGGIPDPLSTKGHRLDHD